MSEKTDLFRLGILRFFADPNAPRFSRASLDVLTSFLHERIGSHQLQLNDDKKNRRRPT